jgi:hypothetical protein
MSAMNAIVAARDGDPVAASHPHADAPRSRVGVLLDGRFAELDHRREPDAAGQRHVLDARVAQHGGERPATCRRVVGRAHRRHVLERAGQPVGAVVPGRAERGEHDGAGAVGPRHPHLVGASTRREHFGEHGDLLVRRAVDTNCVVIHNAARSESASAATIEAAIAVPP